MCSRGCGLRGYSTGHGSTPSGASSRLGSCRSWIDQHARVTSRAGRAWSALPSRPGQTPPNCARLYPGPTACPVTVKSDSAPSSPIVPGYDVSTDQIVPWRSRMSPGYLFDIPDPSEAFSTPLDVPFWAVLRHVPRLRDPHDPVPLGPRRDSRDRAPTPHPDRRHRDGAIRALGGCSGNGTDL